MIFNFSTVLLWQDLFSITLMFTIQSSAVTNGAFINKDKLNEVNNKCLILFNRQHNLSLSCQELSHYQNTNKISKQDNNQVRFAVSSQESKLSFYLCVRAIDFASFSTIFTAFCNCSDSVIVLAFHFIVPIFSQIKRI